MAEKARPAPLTVWGINDGHIRFELGAVTATALTT